MKVAELIAALEKFPQDATVKVADADSVRDKDPVLRTQDHWVDLNWRDVTEPTVIIDWE